MRTNLEDKGCIEHESAPPDHHRSSSGAVVHRRKAMGSRAKAAPAPSKWDDAQKWLVGLSSGGRDSRDAEKCKHRNSNADDRRLLDKMPQRGRNSCSSANEALDDDEVVTDDGETKKVDSDGSESVWRRTSAPPSSVTKGSAAPSYNTTVPLVCVRDMGTEMTPIASQGPSRTATPMRATTPVMRSPMSSRSSTPGRCGRQHGGGQYSSSGAAAGRFHVAAALSSPSSERMNQVLTFFGMAINGGHGGGNCGSKDNNGVAQEGNQTSLESRAIAWDDAERAKYVARYKREEVKIQAWENHEKRKAELEMRKIEVKAERLKIRAQERMADKMAAARRIAEERRTNAEAKLNEQASRASERAEYIRRTGHMPFSFSLKLPSLCGGFT